MMDENRSWLERARTIRALWVGFAVVLAAVVLAELFIDVHGAFGIDGTFGFNAWYGFASCIALILFAKILGALLKRRDRYYDDSD
jgi:hypothetical protein